MKVAVPTWGERVSPVFDVAQRLLVVDIEESVEVARREEAIPETGLMRRATRVADLGVEVLICGAISMPLEQMLLSAGIQVIPQMCGLVEAVLQAFVSGTLMEQQRFLMPGCCGRRRYGRGGGGRHGRGWAGGNR
jgi:predicted Fe-Mo cluster-binding NifX family protein